MRSNPVLAASERVRRAEQFASGAKQLRKIQNQWYAVAYFYAAYQTVRASLMTDPIFDDLPRLRAHNPNWITDDRGNSHHQARRGRGQPASPGVSDLVKALYPQIAVEYTQLHRARASPFVTGPDWTGITPTTW